MPTSCAVIGCSNRLGRDQKSFFRLPKVITGQGGRTEELSQARQSKWLANIGRKNLSALSHDSIRVCSDHFITGQFKSLVYYVHVLELLAAGPVAVIHLHIHNL